MLDERYRPAQPLDGARIAALCPITFPVAALLDVLAGLGAEIRWAAGGDSEIDEAVIAGLSATKVSVFVGERRGVETRWDTANRIFDWQDDRTANLIIDMDGAAARLVHLGVAAEAGILPDPTDDEEATIFNAIRRRLAVRPALYSTVAISLAGLSECTAQGVEWLRRIDKGGGLMFPAIDTSAGGLLGQAPDRDRIATDTLAALLARQALAQIDLFANGGSYRPGVHRFPAGLLSALSGLDPAPYAGGPTAVIAEKPFAGGPGRAFPARQRH